MEMNKQNRRNIIIPILSIVIVLFAVVIKYSLNEDNKKILTTSALMEVVDVADLSTAKFTYNGIADVYKDSEKKKLKYHVLYYSEVKVGVNMKDINFEIDETQKKVIAKLPEVQIQNIDVDENIKFLPENKGWDIKEAVRDELLGGVVAVVVQIIMPVADHDVFRHLLECAVHTEAVCFPHLHTQFLAIQ